ncbi:hypothetical protein RRG08_008337 [Elysia crispata]|uniref:Letm1 RBD domain-containing protein n=1 Tax=Elysia crispata TaxID=231223 RepID=A0AAE1A740_9GAST|nr:hypothetical protein RRG08_008337 [Elysia crispata]
MAAPVRLSCSRFRQSISHTSVMTALNRFKAYQIGNHSIKYTRSIPLSCSQCHCHHSHEKRFFSTKEPEDKVKVPSLPRQYALSKLVTYLSDSIDKLENRLPRTYLAYKTARTGIRSFIGDAKEFYRITKELWSGKSLSDLSRKDLELYRQCSHDLPKMSIALLISLAPGGVLIFPLAYMFPRVLLSHHFWTPKQKEEFLQLKLSRQIKHYHKLLSLLERKMLVIPSEEGRLGLQKVLRKLQTGETVPASEALELHHNHVFEERPFGTDFLSLRHRYHLGKSLGLPFRRKKMVRSALLLHFIDMAMIREGWRGMSDEELDRACMWRGLNPQGLEMEQKVDFLHSWTAVSSVIHEPSVSLLLHLPVLLCYSHPSNKKLLKGNLSNESGE